MNNCREDDLFRYMPGGEGSFGGASEMFSIDGNLFQMPNDSPVLTKPLTKLWNLVSSGAFSVVKL